ncbi:MAG: hypothetical protein IT173_10240 [Acidobacteria bacterium]|nr:hypothetical protein [Acidobacteriota bacterium]
MNIFTNVLAYRALKAIIGGLVVSVLPAISINGQTPSALSADEIAAKAAQQRAQYIDEFKDLLSRETKTYEEFDKSNRVRSTRAIVSTFIVYQSPLTGRIGEFRNVVSVDGKPVEKADKRAEEFFTEIAERGGSAREWERIEKEGSRFDGSVSINGLTLFQAAVLADNIRPSFKFTVNATEHLDGRPVYLLAYEQVLDTRYISMDPKLMVNDGRPELVYDIDVPEGFAARVAGKFWIDQETFQARKEERCVFLQAPGKSTQAIAVETVLVYQESPFSILTPKRFIFTQFRKPRNGEAARKEISIMFSYDNFTRPDVEVKGAVKN